MKKRNLTHYRNGTPVLFPDSPGVVLSHLRAALNPLFASANGNLYRRRDIRYVRGVPRLREDAVPLRPEVRDSKEHPFARVRIRLRSDHPRPKRPTHSVAYLVAAAHGLVEEGSNWRIVPPANPLDCRAKTLRLVSGREDKTQTIAERKKRGLKLLARSYDASDVVKHVAGLNFNWLKRAEAAVRRSQEKQWKAGSASRRKEQVEGEYARTLATLRECYRSKVITRKEFMDAKIELGKGAAKALTRATM